MVAAIDGSRDTSRGMDIGRTDKSRAGVLVLETLDGLLDMALVIRVNSALSPPDS